MSLSQGNRLQIYHHKRLPGTHREKSSSSSNGFIFVWNGDGLRRAKPGT